MGKYDFFKLHHKSQRACYELFIGINSGIFNNWYTLRNWEEQIQFVFVWSNHANTTVQEEMRFKEAQVISVKCRSARSEMCRLVTSGDWYLPGWSAAGHHTLIQPIHLCLILQVNHPASSWLVLPQLFEFI